MIRAPFLVVIGLVLLPSVARAEDGLQCRNDVPCYGYPRTCTYDIDKLNDSGSHAALCIATNDSVEWVSAGKFKLDFQRPTCQGFSNTPSPTYVYDKKYNSGKAKNVSNCTIDVKITPVHEGQQAGTGFDPHIVINPPGGGTPDKDRHDKKKDANKGKK